MQPEQLVASPKTKETPPPPIYKSTIEAILRSAGNLAKLQKADGSWHPIYNGVTSLLPIYIVMLHISGTIVSDTRSRRMRNHLISTLNSDGSIGLHEGGPGTLFTSILGYVALRILGESADEPHMVLSRHWIHQHGGPLHSGSWGKIVLCLLGAYEYRGIHPISPEAWLLPYWLPFHPGRIWCHARQVYLPVAWLYGRRATMAPTELTYRLRSELYLQPYDQIDWTAYRSAIAPSDNYHPLSRRYRAVSKALQLWERLCPRRLRARAIERIEEHIDYEDRVTNYLRLGPTNVSLNTLVQYFRDPGGHAFVRGVQGADEYLWDDGHSISMQGYSSTKTWDTAFSFQALAAAKKAVDVNIDSTLRDALRFLHENQCIEDPSDRARYYREASRGGWTFSIRAQGWTVIDCTAEALKSTLIGNNLGLTPPLANDRIQAAVRFLLSRQNPGGGWSSYERQRANSWLECMNPSNTFEDFMVDYSRVELTSASLQALAAAKEWLTCPSDVAAVDRALRRGRGFLTSKQRDDGSFEGSWGICFTYGTWFGICGLLSAGVPIADPSIQKACQFLLSVQRSDGAWGESLESCFRRHYVPSHDGKAVMTAWALLALIAAGYAAHPAVHRGVRFLIDRQLPDGGFPYEGYAGVFHRTNMINYDYYRQYFPLHALAEWVCVQQNQLGG